ncbi:serine/threonine protein kinase [Candidatus Micrarchaeota archaeon]|nr:serine/threonine protein kinase [Candidatus Micrarchaeota archaeon]
MRRVGGVLTAPVGPQASPFSGKLLDNRFRIGERLAVGGFGMIYAATDIATGSKIVVKTLIAEGAPGSFPSNAFRREILANSMLHHPNLVRFVYSGYADFGSFMVQEFFPAKTFADFFDFCSPSWPARMQDARPVLIAVAKALEHSHSQGIIHADLKPANILVASYSESDIRLIDFGLCRFLDQSLNFGIGLHTSGSDRYMAPEQCLSNGIIDERTDVYTLGIVIGEVLDQIFCPQSPSSGAIQITARVSESLTAMLKRATSRIPNMRFPNMSEFRKAIEALFTPENTVEIF